MVTSIKMETATVIAALETQRAQLLKEQEAQIAAEQKRLNDLRDKVAAAAAKLSGTEKSMQTLTRALSDYNNLWVKLNRDSRYIRNYPLDALDSAIKALGMASEEKITVKVKSDLGRLIGL